MGKLYNPRDLEFDLARIDRLEADAQRTLDPLKLAQLDGRCRTIENRDGKRSYRYSGSVFDTVRQSCKMQLLRTRQVIRDLAYARSVIQACGRCFTDADGNTRYCGPHRKYIALFRMVKMMGEENVAKRLSEGRPAEDGTEERDGSLNKWEEWYFRDRLEGVWPGHMPPVKEWTPDELGALKEQYGSLDYRGWLTMVLQEEEITAVEYSNELARLRGEN